MKKWIASLLLLLFLITGVCYGGAEGINVTFNNTTTEKMVAILYWVDHPYQSQTMGLPISVAGGEIGPGKKWTLINEEPYGEYIVRLLQKPRSVGNYDSVKTLRFEIDENDNIIAVEITPDKIKYKRKI